MTKSAESSTDSATTGFQRLALMLPSGTGTRLGEIGSGRPLTVSAALADQRPEDTDRRLEADLERCSGRSPVLHTRTLFPNDGPSYSVVADVRWDCPREKLPEVVAILEGAFKAAPADRIANELYKLRMLTAGRDQKDAADQEAENVIWLEQLRCYPGDIVINALRSWTKPGNPQGKWWPTWNDIAERLERACDRRQALLNFVRALAARPDPKPALTYQEPDAERRAKAVERWEEMRASFGQATDAPRPETPEQILARLEEMKANASPVVIGEGLSSKLESIKAGKKQEAA